MENLAAEKRTIGLCGREIILTGSAEGTTTTKEHGGSRDIGDVKRSGREVGWIGTLELGWTTSRHPTPHP